MVREDAGDHVAAAAPDSKDEGVEGLEGGGGAEVLPDGREGFDAVGGDGACAYVHPSRRLRRGRGEDKVCARGVFERPDEAEARRSGRLGPRPAR